MKNKMHSVVSFAVLKRVSIGYVYQLLWQGRIEGAVKVDGTWRIPKNASLPSERKP